MANTSVTHLEFLRALEADQLGHSGGDLLSHLEGVAGMLEQWNAPEPLRLAGLYHSVYGTESFSQTALDPSLRDRLRDQIGSEAETLVFYFGMMAKKSFYANLGTTPPYSILCRLTGNRYPLTEREFDALCELTVANWLEQRPRAAEQYQFIQADAFRAMRPHLTEPAWRAISDAYGFERS